MKQILILLISSFYFSSDASAQLDSPNQPACRIWYEYDAAGQRVKRYYECKDPNQELQNADARIRATLYPNPTDGPVIVVVDTEVDEFSASLMTIDGSFITSSSCSNCSDLSLSLAGYPQGSYILQVSAVKTGYPELNEGYKIIKQEE